MVREPSVLTRLSRLRADLALDVSAMVAREAETQQLLSRWRADGALPRAELVLVAVNLHGYYTALETGLERVARLLDEEVPTGPSWHQDLLEQMRIEVAGLRPAVVPAAVLPDLHELRRFRHFFRNAYVLDLDPDKIRSHADRLARVHPTLHESLSALQRHVDAVLEQLTGDDDPSA